MAKFITVEDVKKAFRMRSNGSDTVEFHNGLRYGDIEKHAPIVEQLLKTDYNKITGFSFSEIMEAISHLQQAFGTRTYLNDCNTHGGSFRVQESLYAGEDLASKEDNYFSACEAFEGTTAQQAPYPVPSISFVTYRYEKSVLPFLTHLFDLRGNRGLIYFQKITAVDSMGNINEKDELGNPRKYPAQPVAFGTTKVNNEVLGTLTNGTAEFEATLKFKPQPGSLIINIDGQEGWFQDFQEAQAHRNNVAILTSVNGNLGYATFDYATLKLNLTLATAPAADGLNVRAQYNRDVELKEAGEDATRRIPRFTMSVEAEQVITENVSIQTETNLYQEALARAIFGLDWNAEVDKAMGMIYNKEMANKVVTEIRNDIPAANIISHDITHTLNDTGNGDNKLFNTQFLSVVLGVLRKKIVQASGQPIKKFTTLVINLDLLPIFEALPKFTVSTADDEDQMGGMFLAGLYDGIPVVCGYDDIIPSGEVIALYKNQSREFLTPHVLGIFMDPVVRDVFDQNNLAINRKQLMSTIGTKCIAHNLSAKLTVDKVDELLGVIENN